MKHYLLSVVGVVAVVMLSPTEGINYKDVIVHEWEEFKLQYGKKYRGQEDLFRRKVFMENKYMIASHNQLYEKGIKSYKLAMNKFGDLLHHEFIATMNGLKRNNRMKYVSGSTYLSPANVQIPKRIDWRKKGYVTPVKDQGGCGSCWAFSATGSLEGQHFRKTGKLISLSEQNLIDCSRNFGNQGCDGGDMVTSFTYVEENRGLDSEISYPYKGIDDNCKFNETAVGATDSGFVEIEHGSEEKLKEAVATVGPISVAIDAGLDSFTFYSKGVYDEPNCHSDQEYLDHAVLVVGYDSTENLDYWIVKNSWDTSWGINGYIWMSRNKDNQCGIATDASFPLM